MSVGVVATEWKELHLPQLQSSLDEEAAEVASRQDASETSRKGLVEASKDFKKTASEDVRKTVAPLLKLFQGEVDNLSKRSKASEASFLSLYRKIVALPDPSPALDNAAVWQKKAQRAADLELEVGNLRTTLKQYNDEFADVKNQEVTIRQLREKVKSFEESATAAVEEAVGERSEVLRRELESRSAQAEEASAGARREAASATTMAAQLQQNLDAANEELNRLRARLDDRSDAAASQLDILATDSERATQRAEAAERELVLATTELDALKAARDVKTEAVEEETTAGLAGLQAQLSAKDVQIHRHIEELGRIRAELDAQAKDSEAQKATLKADLETAEAQLRTAQTHLASMGDYDEIKGQLRTMMTMEFGGEGSDSSEGTKKSLEVLLLEKNKALQGDNTHLKVANLRMQGNGGGSSSSLSPQTADGEEDDGTPTPGPFQPLVETFGALLGAEMASTFRPNADLERLRHQLFGFHPNASPTPPPSSATSALPSTAAMAGNGALIKQLLEAGGSAHGADALFSGSPMPSEEPSSPDALRHSAAKQEEPVEAALARLGLPDIETQVKDGMPRHLAEHNLVESLQSIIAENMGKLGDGALNTGQVACHCRTLLSMYNLGQRLFAKSILNQSQGSLSELLSKPRPWQRLTEKGREAFRKMYAWVSDEKAITLLRSLSPRRSYMGLSSGASAHGSFFSSPLDASLDESGDGRRSEAGAATNRWRHDDIPKEMVVEIYQRELAKLKEQENSISQQVKTKTAFANGATTPTPRTPGPDGDDGAINAALMSSFFPERQQRQRGHLRAVLPQISQEQFEEHANLSTEELVRQIKDFLSQHSISQRLFGEHVLGLSQGSVSDLLARPKPWHMLTQKGREPFIRMRLFLSDPEAVETLRSRKANRGASTTLDYASHSPSPATPAPPKYTPILPKHDLSSLLSSASSVASPQHTNLSPRSSLGRVLASSTDETLSSASSNGSAPDLDTNSIADQVRRLLHENSIGQKLFGEAVLGVSQGTVSELLSKPKPWSTLSLRGREPYIRMFSWLQDPLRIQKLQQYLMMLKSVRSNGGGGKRAADEGMAELLTTLFSSQPAMKKPRSLITEQQKEALKFAYEHEPYPSSKTVEFLASELALSIPTVTNWFHNHRMRVKNSAAKGAAALTPSQLLSASPSAAGSPAASPALKMEEEEPEDDAGGPNPWKKGLMDLISMLGDSDDADAAKPVLQA